MNLKAYHTDPMHLPDDDRSDILASAYHQEMIFQKIEKLSTRVTLIFILLPIMVGVVVWFIYMDVTGKMADDDLTRQNLASQISRDVDEKLNSLDIRIAKNRFDLDESFPLLEKKLAATDAHLDKISTTKSDTTAVDAAIARIEESLERHDKRIRSNATQDKGLLEQMETINSGLQDQIRQIETINSGLQDQIRQVETTTSRLQEQMTQMTTSVAESIRTSREPLDKKMASLEKEADDLKKMVSHRMADLEAFQKTLALVTKEIDVLKKTLNKPVVQTTSAPPPPAAPPGSGATGERILEKTLAE